MDNYSSRRDDDMESLDELLFDISRYQNKTDYWKLLKFLRKFRYLSPFNGMLVHLQKEGSEFVLSPTKWKNRFNRIIKANAQPIVILKPFGPVSLVYDINDTEPDPQLRVVPIPEDILHPFKAEGSVPQEMLDRLINNLPREGVRYQEADLGAMMAGFIRVAPKGLKQSCGKTRDGKIKELPVYFDLVINSKLKAEERLPVIAHELGHSFQIQISCDGHGHGIGGGFYEMTSQWMLWNVNPEWPTDENYHWKAFIDQANLQFLDIENIYHSPYVLEYWSMKRGIDFIDELFRQATELFE